MFLSDEALEILVIACAAAVVVLALTSLLVAVRLRRLRSAYAAVFPPAMLTEDLGADVFDAVARVREELDHSRDEVAELGRNVVQLRAVVEESISNVGVVRYDAFEDMGGMLSFSAALLDGRGDGIVISAINGRSDGRTYAKPVAARASEFHLSPEESAAIEVALSEKKGTAVEAPRRRWRRTVS